MRRYRSDAGDHISVKLFLFFDESMNFFGSRKGVGAVVGTDHHGSLCRAELEAVDDLPVVEEAIQETGSIAVAAAEALASLDRERTDGELLAITCVSCGSLHTVLDDDDPCVVAVPHLCALFIGQTGHELSLSQVKLFSGSQDNSGLFCYHRAVDGNLIEVLPVVVSVVDIEDDLCADSSGQHNSLEGSLRIALACLIYSSLISSTES